MSDTMLHGVLCMPPELWRDDSEIDRMQRYQRYLQASRRIEELTEQRDELLVAAKSLIAVMADSYGRQKPIPLNCPEAVAANEAIAKAEKNAGS